MMDEAVTHGLPLHGVVVGVTAERQAEVRVVRGPVLRTVDPSEDAALLGATRAIVAHPPDAVTFTASPAVDNLAHLASTIGLVDALDCALAGPVRAVCVGPVCSATARRRGWRGVIEPERPRLVAMIDALTERCTASSAAD